MNSRFLRRSTAATLAALALSLAATAQAAPPGDPAAEAAGAPAQCFATLGPAGAPASWKLPANAPGVPLTLSVAQPADFTVTPLGALTFAALRDPRGILFVQPSASLPIGPQTLDWSVATCAGVSGKTEFEVTAENPLPTVAATVEAGPDAKTLRFALSKDVTAYGDVALVTVTMPGGPQGAFVNTTTTALEVGAAQHQTDSTGTTAIAPIPELAAEFCKGGSTPLPFEYVLSVHVIGASTDPPDVKATFDVDCDAVKGYYVPPKGDDGGGDGDDTVAGADDSDSGSSGGGGCGVASRSFEGSAAGALGLGLGLAIAVRRVRRRRG